MRTHPSVIPLARLCFVRSNKQCGLVPSCALISTRSLLRPRSPGSSPWSVPFSFRMIRWDHSHSVPHADINNYFAFQSRHCPSDKLCKPLRSVPYFGLQAQLFHPVSNNSEFLDGLATGKINWGWSFLSPVRSLTGRSGRRGLGTYFMERRQINHLLGRGQQLQYVMVHCVHNFHQWTFHLS